jgi:sigma-B regulation protein RsbU (phosphoserine phosphatase)
MKDLSECRVLIVDDVKANVDVLVAALKGEYRFSVVLDGASALKSIAANPPDLVLLDIMMPGIDGFEVCRRMRASPATRGIPVMFLSSLEDVANKSKGFEAGGNDYLTKPFDVLEVKARVRSLVRAKAYADAVQEAADRELNIAREIQTGILPSDIAAETVGTGLDVAALLEPAKAVGGDLYDVQRVADDRVVLSLGDVSGKGVPGALLMAVSMTLLRSIARQHESPDAILLRMNEDLVAHSRRGLFVTMFCACYDARTRRLACANAGHLPSVLLRPARPPEIVLPSSGPMVGVFSPLALRVETIQLAPGDTLVVHSDGVTEAFGTSGEMFGEDRVLEHFDRSPPATASEAVTGLLAAVRRHADGAPQSDDISLLAIRALP